jgi:hypothetical protein
METSGRLGMEARKYVQLLARLSGGSMGGDFNESISRLQWSFRKLVRINFISLGIVSFSLTHHNLRGLCKL